MAQRHAAGGFSLGWVGMLLPVAYCFGLVYYFNSVDTKYEWLGLGQNRDFASTTFGLTVVGLLFCVPLLIKLVRFLASQARTAHPATAAPSSRWEEDAVSSDPDFDADAVIARYLASRGQQAEPAVQAESAATDRESPAQPARPTFGRRKI